MKKKIFLCAVFFCFTLLKPVPVFAEISEPDLREVQESLDHAIGSEKFSLEDFVKDALSN